MRRSIWVPSATLNRFLLNSMQVIKFWNICIHRNFGFSATLNIFYNSVFFSIGHFMIWWKVKTKGSALRLTMDSLVALPGLWYMYHGLMFWVGGVSLLAGQIFFLSSGKARIFSWLTIKASIFQYLDHRGNFFFLKIDSPPPLLRISNVLPLSNGVINKWYQLHLWTYIYSYFLLPCPTTAWVQILDWPFETVDSVIQS